MKNRIMVLLTVTALISLGLFNSFTDYEGVQVYLDESLLEFDSNSEVKDGRTMVSLRFIADSTGADVKCDGDI